MPSDRRSRDQVRLADLASQLEAAQTENRELKLRLAALLQPDRAPRNHIEGLERKIVETRGLLGDSERRLAEREDACRRLIQKNRELEEENERLRGELNNLQPGSP